MPKAFSEDEREHIRIRLLEVGKRLINAMGVRRLVVDDLVREAGIAKGSFYLFFPSREEFILSVFEAWEAEYRGTLIRNVTEGTGTARERLERFFRGAFELLEREPGLARLGSKDIQVLMDRLPPERLAAHQAADGEVIRETLRRWIAEGLLAEDASEAFRGVFVAIFSIAMHREDFPDGGYGPTVRLISEALALRFAPAEKGREVGHGE